MKSDDVVLSNDNVLKLRKGRKSKAVPWYP